MEKIITKACKKHPDIKVISYINKTGYYCSKCKKRLKLIYIKNLKWKILTN